MNPEHAVTVQEALDVVERLSPEDRLTVIEVLERRWRDERREEIARNAASTLQALREGRAASGMVADLKAERSIVLT